MEDILPISLGIAVVVSLLKALYVEKEKRQKEAEAKAASEAEQEKGREKQFRRSLNWVQFRPLTCPAIIAYCAKMSFIFRPRANPIFCLNAFEFKLF
jgi:hypothetical protein